MRNSLIISIAMSLFMVVGCGQMPNAVVKPTKLSRTLPESRSIESISITSDSAAAIEYYPNTPVVTISQIASWLQSAQEVSVQFPKINVQTGPSGGNTGPSRLDLNLKNGDSIEILPAFYPVPAKHGYEDRYLDGIIEYETWDGPVYLKCPLLYTWLKQDQWKNQFHMS